MNNLKFLHIPKTGGSSIEYAARKVGINWGKFDKSLKLDRTYAVGKGPFSKWHIPQSVEGSDMFCVVRNPWDRIISQFYHKNVIKNYTPVHLNRWIEKTLPLILSIQKPKHRKKKKTQDNHLLPQIHFVKHSTYVLCCERLGADLAQLLDIYSLPPMTLGRIYGGHIQNKKRKNITFKRLEKNDISPYLRQELKNLYQEDSLIHNLISISDGPYKQ